MSENIDDLVIDYFHDLFDALFTAPFSAGIAERRKRNAVARRIEEAADAASQSLGRFFKNEKLTAAQAGDILTGLGELARLLDIEAIQNPNQAPETLVESLLEKIPCPDCVSKSKREAQYRLALHYAVQALMRVGPVMAEWARLNYSENYDILRRAVNRLNQISEQMNLLGLSGHDAAGERYELSYRDYLCQRLNRIEAATVRMATNLSVDLQELFVMPRLAVRKQEEDETAATGALMDLDAARRFFDKKEDDDKRSEKKKPIAALEMVRENERGVIVGPPGCGKSTFLEWLQLRLAAGEEVLVLNGEQAIPLLLRVRQLDLQALPQGGELIARAAGSRDQAALMPDQWIHRQMTAGRVFFMLDGLDETEPRLRDECLLPWLKEMMKKFPRCRYLVTSRPVGYPPGFLKKYKFTECELLDFNDAQIKEYARHWCTAARLAQNELEEEARREGQKDGDLIHAGFREHPYIRNLARNPLMLSAICLVNYFEGGKLPEDRALLYRLCAEGLLHNWDQRRGIHSEFTLEEKLRACRETAIAMQAESRAESPEDQVRTIFKEALNDEARGAALFEHIRYRAGLLVERRGKIYAFAHLTFQEYLAAVAVHEGNKRNIAREDLVRRHDAGQWQEVISLYCGIAPEREARTMLASLMNHEDTLSLAGVLTEAFFASGAQLTGDAAFRRRIIERVAVAPWDGRNRFLNRFPENEVSSVANAKLGRIASSINLSEAYRWLFKYREHFNAKIARERLNDWNTMTPMQICETFYLLHALASADVLLETATNVALYESPGPELSKNAYSSQALVALFGLSVRNIKDSLDAIDLVAAKCLPSALKKPALEDNFKRGYSLSLGAFFRERIREEPPDSQEICELYANAVQSILKLKKDDSFIIDLPVPVLKPWLDELNKKLNQRRP